MVASISDYALSSPDRVEQYLGLTGLTGKPRDQIIFFLNAVSMWAKRYTGLPLKQTTFEFSGAAGAHPRLDGDGSRFLWLPVYPIVRLTHINTDHENNGDDSTEELDFTWSTNTDNGEWDYGVGSDYTYNPATGQITLHGGAYFSPYEQNVVVKCEAGFSTDTSSKSNYQGPHFLNTHPDFGWDGAGQMIEMSVVQQAAEMYHRKTRQKDGIASYSTEAGTITFSDRELLPEVKLVWDHYKRLDLL